MPRNPPKSKTHHRHENGIVGPGRVLKKRSNGHINGNSKGPVPDTPPLTPTISDPVMTTALHNHSNSSLPETKLEPTEPPRPEVLRKRGSESSYDGQDMYANGTPEKSHEDTSQRRADTGSTKNKTSHDFGPFQLASTILRSCPAYDTIAILILLLQLPPIMLTIIQALFASLTFMPPSGLSLGSMFSLFDVFQGSAGTPSLGTMIFVDAICLGGWYCLWTWAQNFALDLAQVQVAITLGGGNAGKGGSVNSACVAIVLMLHLFRSKGVRQFFFSQILSAKVTANAQIAQLMQFLPHDSEFGSTPASPYWLQSLFAIHIITQAGIAIVRRRVASSQLTPSSKGNKRTDTEASAGSQPPPESSAFESGTSLSSATGADFQPPSTPGLKEGKEKSVSAKKRRRQANQVRSRQPFWAAVASTKVTVMREYEHSRGPSKVAGHRSANTNIASSSGEEVIWITHVDPSSIKFGASNISATADEDETGLDPSFKPFLVRINGATWAAVSVAPIKTTESADFCDDQWVGEIYGLAPNCTYTCSFVRVGDDREFSTIMVKTPALPDKDQGSLAPAPPRQSLRPSSPTTTIKNSIQTAEARLNEARNRLTKARRSHKAALSKIEKEVDTFNTRLKSSSDDTKQRQKLLQAERNIRQTEDDTQTISTALDDLSLIPEEEVEEWSSRKEAFQAQSDLLSTAAESLASARAAAKGDLSTVSGELNTVSARRERLVARQARLAEQHDRITQANAQGLNEKERRAAEALAKESEQARIESDYHTQFNYFNREIQNLQMRTGQAWQEVQAFEKHAQREMSLKNAAPLTPEGNLPGTNVPQAATARQYAFGFPTLSMASAISMSPEPAHPSPFLAYAKTLPSENNLRRPRSASNRSGGAVSNFSADFEDADPIPPMPAVSDFDVNMVISRKESGSSRGANDSSPGAIGTGGVTSPVKGKGSPGHGIW